MDEIFVEEDLIELLTETKDEKNILHVALESENPDIFNFILKNMKQLLNESDFGTLLLAKDYYDRNILYPKTENVFETVCTSLKQNSCVEYLKTLLNFTDKDDRTGLHRACEGYNFQNMTSFCTALCEHFEEHEIEKMCFDSTNNGTTAVMFAAENNHENLFEAFWELLVVRLKFDFEKQKKILFQKNALGHTAFYCAAT